MDDCHKCCEVNAVSLTYGSLQVLPWNNDSIIEKMAGWKWCHHITDFFQYMHAWNQGCIKIIIYDIFLLQFLFCKTQQILKNAWIQCSFMIKKGLSSYGWLQLESWTCFEKRDDYKCLFQRNTQHCKWRPETMTVPLKCMAASAPLK